MSTFHVCDWCGEPIDGKPTMLIVNGPSMWCEYNHYHGSREDLSCLGDALRALKAVQDEHKMQEAPR